MPPPNRWAALLAAAPPILLAVSYWRIAAFGLDLDWTVVALALAALELAAACWAAQRRDGEAENELVLVAYAVGVLGCTILAAVFSLENAWLTVALALHLPALAWVEGRLRLPVLRHVALGVAAAVLVRLILNPEVLRYALSDALIFKLAALRLRRTGGGVHPRHPAVRQPRRRPAGKGARGRQRTLFGAAGDPRAVACAE